MKKGGYRFSYTYDQIAAHRQLSAKDKLNWLEEANRFSYHFIRGKTRKVWEDFRRGNI